MTKCVVIRFCSKRYHKHTDYRVARVIAKFPNEAAAFSYPKYSNISVGLYLVLDRRTR